MMKRGERNLRSFFELVFCLWIRAGLVPVILWVVFLLVSDLCFATAQFNGTGTGLSRTQLLRIEKHLKRLNKEAVKSIQSPDGDVIDCVLAHKQPAFDHPRVKGLKPEEPPVTRPKGYHSNKETSSSSENLVNFQIWHQQAERCPEGSIPIRRTKREDILRFGSVKRYGRKKLHHRPFPGNPKRRDSLDGGGHEHAVGYVAGDEYYGAKSSLNVWSPHIQKSYEFSLSQMWLISGPFGNDLNTIEAGWQVSPELYGDSYPRFFTYWTTDAYQATGCYNLLCSGFVQTNNGVAIGAAISPTSVFNGAQYDISLLVWKDPNKGNWWLEFGNGMLVGYWPSFLFSHLAHHATMVQWGGEIVNTSPGGRHTGTQMGSGHFAEQGFAKASYFRNLEVVDWDNSLISLTNMQVLADHPNCYNIQAGFNEKWGNYFYYGGPGRNSRCP